MRLTVDQPKVTIVVPVFNEEGNVALLFERVKGVLGNDCIYEVLFVDDGSFDQTLPVLRSLGEQEEGLKYISLSRNFGHQCALKAGLDHAQGDCVITMDGDLQHPPELIPQMIDRWNVGVDVVQMIRGDEGENSWLKKVTSRLFYWLLNLISDVRVDSGSADFRLLDRRAIDVLKGYGSGINFIRGEVRWLGFIWENIRYVSASRHSGKPKYSTLRMFRLAISGVVGLSTRPLHLSTVVGSFVALLAFLYGAYALIVKLLTNSSVSGWTSILVLVAFLGGVQLITIGIMGEYLGRIYVAVKERPPYLIKEVND